MFVRRHRRATTTPKIPAPIQARDETAWVLAEHHRTPQNATERHRTPKQIVWKWRKRDSVQDHSHTAPTVFRPPSHQRKRPWRLLCATFDGCRQMIDWRWCASFSIRLCLVRVWTLVCVGTGRDVFVIVRPRMTHVSTVDLKCVSPDIPTLR